MIDIVKFQLSSLQEILFFYLEKCYVTEFDKQQPLHNNFISGDSIMSYIMFIKCLITGIRTIAPLPRGKLTPGYVLGLGQGQG